MIEVIKRLRLPQKEIQKWNDYLSGETDFKKDGIEVNKNVSTYVVYYKNGVICYIDFYTSNDKIRGDITLYRDGFNIGSIRGIKSLDGIYKFKTQLSNVCLEHTLIVESDESPFLLCIEGNEASGKSTIAKELIKKIEEMNRKVIYSREPGGVLTAEKIRNLILEDQEDGSVLEAETEAYLFAAARSEHVKKKVVPALKNNTSVIMDRYFYSSLAYQGIARELGFEKVYEINKQIIEHAYPNLTLYLKISPEERELRLNKRGIENRLDRESNNFVKKVDEGFEKCLRFEEFVEIDANSSVEVVVDRCLDEMKKFRLI